MDKKTSGQLVIWGESFNTINEIEVKYNIPIGSLSQLKNKEDIEKKILKLKDSEVKSNYNELKGIAKLARRYGIQPDNVYQRLKKDWDITEAIIRPVNKRYSSKLRYNGKEYSSRAELASYYNIDTYYISTLSESLNRSWEETFNLVNEFILSNNIYNESVITGEVYHIIYDGVYFNTIDDVIERYNLKNKYTQLDSKDRLDYLINEIGEPKELTFNYSHEWNKFIQSN